MVPWRELLREDASEDEEVAEELLSSRSFGGKKLREEMRRDGKTLRVAPYRPYPPKKVSRRGEHLVSRKMTPLCLSPAAASEGDDFNKFPKEMPVAKGPSLLMGLSAVISNVNPGQTYLDLLMEGSE